MLHHQLDVRPLVNKHAPETITSTRKAQAISKAKGAHSVPLGEKNHVRARKSGHWEEASQKIREEEGVTKKKKKKKHKEKTLTNAAIPNSEIANSEANYTTPTGKKRRLPHAPDTSPEEKKQRTTPVKDQESERIRHIDSNAVQLSVTQWVGLDDNNKRYEYQYRALFFAPYAVSNRDRMCSSLNCETRGAYGSDHRGLLKDYPQIEIEYRKVEGNGVQSPNAKWKLQSACCRKAST